MKRIIVTLLVLLINKINAQNEINAKIDWFKDKVDSKIEILGVVNNQIIGILKEDNSITYVKISENGVVSKKAKLPYKFDEEKYSYLNTILTKNGILVLIKENREKELAKEEEEKKKKEAEDIRKGKSKEQIEKNKADLIRKKIDPRNKEKIKKFNDSIRELRLENLSEVKKEKIKKEKELILGINIGTELNVNNKPIKVKGITVKEKIKYYANYTFSNDSTKILVYNQLRTGINEQLRYSFSVIDNNLTNKEIDSVFEIPMLMVNPAKVKFSTLYMDNNNNIVGFFREIREIENNNSRFFFKTLIFDNIQYKPRAFDIDFEGSMIDNIEVFPQENNKYYVVGFLAGIKKGVKFSGKASAMKNEVFLAELNSEQKTYKKIFQTNVDALYPYNNLKITNYMPYKAESLYETNNDFTIIAHQINKKTKINTINPGEEINYDDKNIFYGDVSIIKVNKKGILTFNGSISKYQSPLNKNQMMLYTYRNDKLYSIFEDNISNVEVDYEVDPWTTIRNNERKNLDKSLYITSLDSDRKIIKESLYDYKKNSNRIILKKSIRIKNNTFLLIGENSIGKLTIN